ncbi:MAG: amidohydrolase family protein [Chitinophagaceae bacterium]
MFRKIQASQLFDGFRLHHDSPVLLLRSDDSVEAILPAAEAGEDIEVVKGLLCPGFVNSHCHLELSHLVGIIPQHTGLPQFLQAVIKSAPVSPELQLSAMQLADQQMLENGIVAVGDICNTAASLPAKKQSRLLYYNFIETMGLADSRASQRFELAEHIFRDFESVAGRFAGNAIVPHAPYSIGAAMAGLITGFAENKLLSIHSQESAAEEQLFREGGGPFLDFYQALGLPVSPWSGRFLSGLHATLSQIPASLPMILVHNVETSKADLQFAFQQKGANRIYWCLCPAANLYISNKLPDVELLLANEAQLIIGTDSLASNHALDVLSEIRLIRQHFPKIPLEKILQWATSNGAKALQIDDRIGSFEAGKKPGVLLLSKTLDRVTRIC